MSIMSIPSHIPASSERFTELFSKFFERGALHKVYFGTESGYPGQEYLSAGITRVPFIIVCLEGTVEVGTLSGKQVRREILRENEGIFLKAGTWIYCDHSNAPLYFRLTLDADHTLFGVEQKTKYRPLSKDSNDQLELFISPHLPEPSTQSLVQRIECVSQKQLLSPWGLHAVNLLLAELSLLPAKTEPEPKGKAYTSWLSIRTYLHEHCHLPLDRKNVASVFSLTPNHVSRLFGQFSEGFNETLEKIRMDRAILLLRSSNLTISEIAFKCGFTTANYFIRVFRTSYEMTPGGYRTALRPQK